MGMSKMGAVGECPSVCPECLMNETDTETQPRKVVKQILAEEDD